MVGRSVHSFGTCFGSFNIGCPYYIKFSPFCGGYNLDNFCPLVFSGDSIYEIPIDSRITKWLNDFGFPIKLSATALADHNYYNFVSDGFQVICKACDIKPCVMDAVIFSSFDKKWTKDNVVC